LFGIEFIEHIYTYDKSNTNTTAIFAKFFLITFSPFVHNKNNK